MVWTQQTDTRARPPLKAEDGRDSVGQSVTKARSRASE